MRPSKYTLLSTIMQHLSNKGIVSLSKGRVLGVEEREFRGGGKEEEKKSQMKAEGS
jgi:hypothetical protein